MSYRDMIQQTLELSETTSGAIDHIQHQVAAGEFEAALHLFSDTIHSILEMMKTVQLLDGELEVSHTVKTSEALQEHLAKVASLFEKREFGAAGLVVANQLKPSYEAWQRQLYSDLQPTAMS